MNERVADIPALKFNGMFDTDVGEMKVTFFMTSEYNIELLANQLFAS